MKIHKQGITFVLLLLIFTSCSRKQSLQWIPFSWEGDSISGIYIEKAYNNKANLNRMGELGHSLIDAELGWDKIAKQVQELYLED